MEKVGAEEKTEHASKTEGEKSIRVVQRALQGERGIGQVNAALRYIGEYHSWKEVGFDCFAEFALARIKDDGLEIRELDDAKLLRYHLLKTKRFELWGELLERIQKPQGRPKKNPVIDEDKYRFYPAPTAATDSDSLIPKLRSQSPDDFAEACAGKVTLRQAALKAGIIEKPRQLCGICNIERVKKLDQKEQIKFLIGVFRAVDLEAQCELLSREVDRKLNIEVALRWREAASEKRSGRVIDEGHPDATNE